MGVLQQGEYVRAVARHLLYNQSIVNTYYFQVALGNCTETEAMDAILGWLSNLYLTLQNRLKSALQHADVSFSVVNFDQNGKVVTVRPLGVKTWSPGWSYQNTSDAAPLGVCALVSFRTAGLRAVAKKFIGGVVEEQLQSDGTWSSTMLSSLAAFAAYILNPLNDPQAGTAVLQPGIWSKRAAAFQILALVGGALIRAIPAYQRRRKPGVGA